MANVIDCRYLAELSLNKTRSTVHMMGGSVSLGVVQVGHDPASDTYIRGKKKDAEYCGIIFRHYWLDERVSFKQFRDTMREANSECDGVIVQLPLPDIFAEMTGRIDSDKDVDCQKCTNMGSLMMDRAAAFAPCTPKGIMYLLKMEGVDLDGKNAVVVGRSNLVGKPMAAMLTNADATVTLCHSHTRDLADVTRRADILVVAAGHPGLITADMVKEGAVVIDVGINRTEDGKLVGDVDFDGVKDVAGMITPVPGGVGLLTRAMLMENVAVAAARRRKK